MEENHLQVISYIKDDFLEKEKKSNNLVSADLISLNSNNAWHTVLLSSFQKHIKNLDTKTIGWQRFSGKKKILTELI